VARPYDVAVEIDKLGENGDQWVDEYGGASRRAAEREMRRMNQSNREQRRPGVL
jgi:hypothetical protein